MFILILQGSFMLGAYLSIVKYVQTTAQILTQLPPVVIQQLASAIYAQWQNGGTIFLCGNGGSGANASHIGEDLSKSTLNRHDLANTGAKRLRVISLAYHTSAILAWANDEGFENVFVEQLKGLASEGDLLIAFSGSGNSPNVLRNGGGLRTTAQHLLHVPLQDMGIIESVHLLLMHWIIDDVYARIHREGRYAARTEWEQALEVDAHS